MKSLTKFSKMNFKKIFLFTLFSVSINIAAQKCNCKEEFNWLKETFETNDAGFKYVIDKKGETAYQNHNKLFADKAKKVTELNECRNVLFDWMLFFRPSHLSIAVNSKPISKTETGKKAAAENNWEKIEVTETELKEITSKIKHPTFEGIWLSPPYTIGVVKRENQYIGFVLDVKNSKWKQYQVKFKITEKPDKTYDAVYYMGDYSAQRFNNVEFIGNNILKIGFIALKRSFPDNLSDSQEIKDYIELYTAQKPFLKEISKQTVVLRIPSFDYSNKKIIDSLLTANHNLITSKDNLIIDVRNNGGGSDAAFQKIIPYLYTNPIRNVGVEYLSTVQNNKRMLEFMSNPDWSAEDKEWAKKGFEKLNANIGKFVNLNEQLVTETKLDVFYKNPKNIAIIINENNASTTEQFLLVAKQSKKVKLFGRTTEGVLDISNMYFVDSPSKNFKLSYSLTKSFRIPDMQIDGKGIQPDFYIDRNIPDYQWTNFTEERLNVN